MTGRTSERIAKHYSNTLGWGIPLLNGVMKNRNLTLAEIFARYGLDENGKPKLKKAS